MIRQLITPMLLLLAIAAWFWFAQVTPPGDETTSVPTSSPTVAVETVAAVPQAEPGLPGLATPWAAAGLEVAATPEATAATPVEPIELLGPPSGSQFGADDTVAFYWRWSGPPAEGQQFVVYVLAAAGQVALGVVDEMNLGQVYHLVAPVGEIVGEAGGYQWLVVLEAEPGGAILGQSESRTIGIVGG